MKSGNIELPTPDCKERPMTMCEKIIAKKLLAKNGNATCVEPHNAVLAAVNGGYSHEFTTAQVHEFLKLEYGENYTLPDPNKFAVFEDHLLYATGVPRFGPFAEKIQTLRNMQNIFQQHTGVRDYSAQKEWLLSKTGWKFRSQ